MADGKECYFTKCIVKVAVPRYCLFQAVVKSNSTAFHNSSTSDDSVDKGRLYCVKYHYLTAGLWHLSKVKVKVNAKVNAKLAELVRLACATGSGRKWPVHWPSGINVIMAFMTHAKQLCLSRVDVSGCQWLELWLVNDSSHAWDHECQEHTQVEIQDETKSPVAKAKAEKLQMILLNYE
jgi:hypothetical protein